MGIFGADKDADGRWDETRCVSCGARYFKGKGHPCKPKEKVKPSQREREDDFNWFSGYRPTDPKKHARRPL